MRARSIKYNRWNETLMLYGGIIFIVPLCAILVIYLSGVFFVKNETLKANEIVLNQLNNSIDTEFSELRNVATLLQTQGTFQNILNETGEISANDRYEYTQFAQTIFPMIASESFVDEYLLYFDAQKLMFNASGYKLFTGLTEQEFESFFVKLSSFSYFLKQHYANQLLPVYKPNTKEVEKFLYVTSIEGGAVGREKVQFAATIDKSAVDDMLSNVSAYGDDMFFCMLDSTTGVPFYTNNEALLPYLAQQDISAFQSGQYASVNQTNDYFFYTSVSDITNVNYVLFVASERIKSATQNIRIIALLCAGFFCAVAVMVFRMIRTREYNAIVTTLSLLNAGEKQDAADNAFEFIKNNVSSLVFDKQEIEHSLLESQRHLRIHFLTRLLIHKVVDQKSYLNLLEYHNVQFRYAKFRVFIFRKQGIPQESMTQTRYDNLLDVVQTEIQQTISEQVQFFSIYLNGTMVMIMNYDFDFSEKEKTLYERPAYQTLLEKEPFIMVVSSLKKDIFGLHAAYDEAQDALEQCLFAGVMHKEYNETEVQQRYPEQVKYYRYEENFKKALQEGNAKSAETLLKNMLQLLKTSFASQNSVVRCKLYGLINIMMSSSANSERVDLYALEHRVKTCKTNHDLYDAIVIIFRDYMKPLEKQDTFLQSIERFVEQHYANPTLSVGMIATWLEMDLSVLSRRFKKERGINISDYIHLVRINSAKELLGQPDHTIKAIAEQCGYINSDIFIRAFKRYEGVSPGKYREKME